MSDEMIPVQSEAVEWLKKHYPALCEKSGLCERIAGKLYTRTALTAQPAAPDWATINTAIARRFPDDPANACRAHAAIAEVLRAQPAASAEPSDEEIAAVLSDVQGRDVRPTAVTVDFARALLSRYGRPAGDAQPVAFLCRECDEEGWSTYVVMPHEVPSTGEFLHVEPLYAAPVAAQKADDALRTAVKTAYGYLWHVNNEPGTPNQYAPERAAYEARKMLRAHLTKDERGEGINAARAAIAQQSQGEGGGDV